MISTPTLKAVASAVGSALSTPIMSLVKKIVNVLTEFTRVLDNGDIRVTSDGHYRTVSEGMETILEINGKYGLVTDAGEGTLVNGRTSTATDEDWEGNILDCKANEIRYDKGRRVENLLDASNDFSDAGWIMEGVGTKDGLVGDGFQITFDSTTSSRLYIEDNSGPTTSATSIEVRTVDGSSTVRVRTGSVDSSDFPIDTTWRRLAISATHVGTANVRGLKNNSTGTTGTILIRNAQSENVTNQSNQNPAQYIDSDTIYNAGIPGVKYLSYQNGNTVDGNGVVTEAKGAALPDMKMLHEGEGTNLLTWSEDFSNAAWVKGVVTMTPNQLDESGGMTATLFETTESSTSLYQYAAASGAATWVASVWLNAVNPFLVAFQIRGDISGTFSQNINVVSGWNKYTVSFVLPSADTSIQARIGGSSTWQIGEDMYISKFQLETSSYPTSYIPTTTAAVTRSKDSINLDLVLGSNFNQNKGILEFQWEAGYDSATRTEYAGLFSVVPGFSSVLYDHLSNIFASSDNTSYTTIGNNFSSGDTIRASVCWNAAENLFSINYSTDLGVTWSTWAQSAYDGAFTTGTLINLFYDNPYINKLDFAKVHKVPASLTIADMQTFVENQA